MDFITALWLPILVSAVAVFVACAVGWMVIGHHNKDYKTFPKAEELVGHLKAWNAPHGSYMFPTACEGGTAEERKKARERMFKDPTGLIVIMRPANMGLNMLATFSVNVLVSVLIAYVGWNTLAHGPGAGASFGQVFQVLGTVGVLAYTASSIPNGIWYQMPRRAMLMNFIDGVVSGLMTGAIFSAMWPAGPVAA